MMTTGILKIAPPKSFAFCLLALAAIGFDAQASHPWEEACPLPPGVTSPIGDPSVTAQQVENDTTLLAQFLNSSRADFKQAVSTGGAAALHFGCLIRQEGGSWRSGSTYLVQLAPTGRVFVHAKDMALSGGLLNPKILATILTSLGVPQADLGNPTAVSTRLLQEPVAASFNAGIAGASGYATAYRGNVGTPIILLAGFDLRASHLVPEAIDYGNPAITARDVVDRETLKTFVTSAIDQFMEFGRTGGRDGLSKAKVAFRDPNGPWRHGSVYLYILDLTSNLNFFHGAFPNKYEVRPLTESPRDAVTGKLILPQIIAAAQNNPEGGFVQYYFDDPDDEADSADIPKVGYARTFEVQRAGGRIGRYIAGSGFYLSDPSVTTHRQNLTIETIQPQVMRAMTASTVDAVSSRIEQAISDTPQAAGLNFGGASSLSDALLAHGEALENGSFDLGRLLAGSSFTLPLNAADTGGGLLRNVTIWGSGDYRDFSGGDRKVMDYEGDVISLSFGMDSRLGEDLLAGISFSRARAEVDYDGVNGGTGESTTTLTSVNPYAGWRVDHCVNLWVTAGYGWGDVQIDDDAAVGAQESDLEQQMAAAGVSGMLVDSDQVIKGGTTTVRVKAETAYTWADIDGEGTLKSLTLDANRSRLMLEGTHERPLDSGGTLTSSLELGVRHDGGDGEDGEGFETGVGLRYANPSGGVTIESRARALLGHDGDYDEWGISGLVRLDPGADGVGLALSVEPTWGQTAGGVQQLWENHVIGGASLDGRSPLRMNARVAYGMVALWGGRQGVLTPYADMLLSGEGSRRLSMGGQFNVGESMRMSLEIMHDQPAHGDSDHGLMLRSDLNW